MKTPPSDAGRSNFSLLLYLKVRSIVFMGYSYRNICRGVSRQGIWHWNGRRTWTGTRWYKFHCQKQGGRNVHCRHGSRCASLFLRHIHTAIFAEDFRPNIFDTGIVATVGCALVDQDSKVRRSAITFFIAAIAQGAVRCFQWTFIPKYSQRGFGTRYVTLRSSPHLDVH